MKPMYKKKIKSGEKFEIAGMQWGPKRNSFKGCNGKAEFFPDSCIATSYGWWAFVTKVNGKIVFNEHKYSNTTSGHQTTMRRLLNELGIKIDLYVDTSMSLSRQGWENDALRRLYERLIQNSIEMKRVGASVEKNKERANEAARIKKQITILQKMGASCHEAEQREIQRRLEAREARRIEDDRTKREANKLNTKLRRDLLKNAEPFTLS